MPQDGVSPSKVRFFRTTSTTGIRAAEFFRGDGSTTKDAQIGIDGTPTYFRGGSVGVGTIDPQRELHVEGVLRASRDGNQFFEIDDSTSDGAFLRATTRESNKKNLYIENLHDGTGSAAGPLNMYFRTGSTASPNTKLMIEEGGDIGIGTVSPQARLDVWGGTGDVARFDTTNGNTPVVFARQSPDSSGGPQELRISMDDQTASLHLVNDESVGMIEFRIQNTDTEVGGGGAANDNVPLTLIGNASGAKARVPVLEITGADLVEAFDTGGAVHEPGTVLVIDPDLPGQLEVSSVPYDMRVAGVVSGAGGVPHGILPREGEQSRREHPVAMTGRVYVKATAENGAIRPGDRLTTSSLAGHAMRATDRCAL